MLCAGLLCWLQVRFGKTLVVREVDRIEPLLVPLLRHDLERQGPRFVVGLGDKLVDFNDTFR
jgi:dynein heavy chain 2